MTTTINDDFFCDPSGDPASLNRLIKEAREQLGIELAREEIEAAVESQREWFV